MLGREGLGTRLVLRLVPVVSPLHKPHTYQDIYDIKISQLLLTSKTRPYTPTHPSHYTHSPPTTLPHIPSHYMPTHLLPLHTPLPLHSHTSLPHPFPLHSHTHPSHYITTHPLPLHSHTPSHTPTPTPLPLHYRTPPPITLSTPPPTTLPHTPLPLHTHTPASNPGTMVQG